MNKYRTRTMLATEEAEIDSAVTEILPSPELEVEQSAIEVIPDTESETEQGSNEIIEAQQDINDMATAAEEAVEDTNTLQEIQEAMADGVKDEEEPSQAAAEIAEVAIEAICLRLGIRSNNKIIPAIESFNSKTTHHAATRVAIENIGELLKKAWEKIVQFFITLKNKIVDFFKSIFSSVEEVKQLATKIKKIAATAKGKTAKSTEPITFGSDVANVFEIKEDFIDDRSIINAINICNDNTHAVLNAIEIVHSTAKNCETLITGTMQEAVTATKSRIATINYRIKKIKTPNGEAIATLDDKTGKVTIDIVGESSKNKKSVKYKVIPAADIERICDHVLEMIKRTEAFKIRQSEIEKIYSSFIDLAKDIAKKNITVDNEKEIKEVSSYVRNFLTSLNNSTSTLITIVPSYNVKTARAALTVASANLKRYV